MEGREQLVWATINNGERVLSPSLKQFKQYHNTSTHMFNIHESRNGTEETEVSRVIYIKHTRFQGAQR